MFEVIEKSVILQLYRLGCAYVKDSDIDRKTTKFLFEAQQREYLGVE